MIQLPQQFLSRIKEIIPADKLETVMGSFNNSSYFAIRVNTLKATSIQEITDSLKVNNIEFKETIFEETFFIEEDFREKLGQLDIYKDGKFYIQNISSQFVAKILEPKPEDLVLDMCAAPGSKTTQLAAMMGNKGKIIALEKVVPRYHKLKSVVQLLGAKNVEVKCVDAKRFRPVGTQRTGALQFDKILVDAPCSSEGRFNVNDAKSLGYWSPRKIKEMKTKQKGILLRAAQLLKPGGTLVYSTCTFAPEENEEVVNWVLGKMAGSLKVMPISTEGLPTYPALLSWEKKTFSDEIKRCVRIMPDGIWHGFFMAKLKHT